MYLRRQTDNRLPLRSTCTLSMTSLDVGSSTQVQRLRLPPRGPATTCAITVVSPSSGSSSPSSNSSSTSVASRTITWPLPPHSLQSWRRRPCSHPHAAAAALLADVAPPPVLADALATAVLAEVALPLVLADAAAAAFLAPAALQAVTAGHLASRSAPSVLGPGRAWLAVGEGGAEREHEWGHFFCELTQFHERSSTLTHTR